MIELSWPAGLSVSRFSLSMICDVRLGVAAFKGSESVVDLLDDYWEANLSINFKRSSDAGALEAFVNRLNTGTYFVKFGHLAKPAPFGTLTVSTGTLYVAEKTSDTIVIQAEEGKTLLAGDMLSADGLLLQVAEDAVADENDELALTLVNRLRRAIPAFSDVVLAAPVTSFVLSGDSGVSHSPNFTESVQLSFKEKIFG